MNIKEINDALAILNRVSYDLESEYQDNGGEVTDLTEQMEAEKQALKDLLNTEGVNSLGRWLKGKEDELKALKSEKDYVSRKIDALNKRIDYIKGQINYLMTSTGEERIKGSLGYSFATTTSVKTSVEKDVLDEMFLSAVEAKLRGKNPVIPADVTISLGASVKALPEGAELPSYYTRTSSPSVRFTKPRANSARANSEE